MIMTYNVKDDPILQDFSHDPSMSYKYDFEDGGFLTHFYSWYASDLFTS